MMAAWLFPVSTMMFRGGSFAMPVMRVVCRSAASFKLRVSIYNLYI